jgi:hypothetical protein
MSFAFCFGGSCAGKFFCLSFNYTLQLLSKKLKTKLLCFFEPLVAVQISITSFTVNELINVVL